MIDGQELFKIDARFVFKKAMIAMRVTLLIFFLSVESSYSQDCERAVDGFADTVQWMIRDDAIWRTKTFAIDEDVHPHKIGRDDRSDERWVEYARQNTTKHYGDIIFRELLVISDEGIDGLREEMSRHSLEPNLNIGEAGLIFWSPSGSNYSTKSNP